MANAVADALTEGKADVNDIVKIVKDVVEQADMALPSRLVGFDPMNCTVEDCRHARESDVRGRQARRR